MKSKSKLVYLLSFFALFVFLSCQNEIIDTNTPDGQEIIDANSTLVNLMQYTSANDGSLDDLLDNTNCLEINLPVTIVVNDIIITINTLEDLVLIEMIFNAFEDDDDILEFLFPITIILNDYTEIVIENQEELEAFIEDCIDDAELIDCVDFQYPISFSIYDSEFNIIDTVIIESNEELYLFLENLEDDNNGVVLASLNFPVTLIYANGDMLEVNNNQELEAALIAAEEACDDDDDDDDCTQENVSENLQECYWRIVLFNGDDNFIQYELYFNDNGILEIIGGDAAVVDEGSWSMSLNNDGLLEILISNLTVLADDLDGSWIVVDCDDDDSLELVGETDDSTTTIVLEQDCEGNMVAICHIPPGNPENAHTITISVNALSAHLAHGDSIGECDDDGDDDDDDDDDCTQENVSENFQECYWRIVLYNGDDNFIQYGLYFNENGILVIIGEDAAVVDEGSWSMSLNNDGLLEILIGNLTVLADDLDGSWVVVDCDDDSLELVREADDSTTTIVLEQDCEENMVTICHIPPGEPENAHTITISVDDLSAHLAHGDSIGDCDDDD